MLDDYSSSYKRTLKKYDKCSMDVNRKHKLHIEIFKSLNNLNPSFMKEIFDLRLYSRLVREKYKLNLNVPRKKQVAFGTLKSLRARIWHNVPYHIKSAKNVFKDLIKNGTIPPAFAVCVPYTYLITIFFVLFL